jgi:pimeloyl-ACP methyl ester carboxylesterase
LPGIQGCGKIAPGKPAEEPVMPSLNTDDGVRLHYEDTGEGQAIVFVHEFAGDHRSWEPQVRHFARRYRCITYSARGYPPSDVPEGADRYSQERWREDLRCVIEALGLHAPHVVGLSMGAFATLHFGLRHPDRAISLVAAGVGYGAEPGARARFRTEIDASSARMEAQGMATFAAIYGSGPTRLAFPAKDPRGHAEFLAQLAEHSTQGSVLTMRGVQRERPGLFDLEAEFRALATPTLVVCGDEDEPTLLPGLFLKRTIPACGLVVLPRTGHAINLEEPDAFNRAVLDFTTLAEAGRWLPRNPAALSGGILTAGT